GLPGVIGRAVLATLLPTRRPRYSARKIKTPTSRYQARHDPRPHTTTAITAIGITITTPALDPRPRRTHYTPKTPGPPGPHPAAQRGHAPAARKPPPSSPASPRATGHHENSPACSTSTPATWPPSYANGPCSAS